MDRPSWRSDSTRSLFDRWQWVSTRARALAEELVSTVALAERSSEGSDTPQEGSDTPQDDEEGRSRAGWARAVELAERLKVLEPGLLPGVVREAIERARTGASRLSGGR